MSTRCPPDSFRYNGTLCACEPGHYALPNASACALFTSSAADWQVSSGIDSNLPTFLTTVLPLDSIKRITQSQAVLLEATLVLLCAWLLFCFLLRFD